MPSTVLFAILTSRATRQRAISAWTTWCADDGATCRFFADAAFGSDVRGHEPRLRWTAVRSAVPRGGCCKRGRKTGFFCSPHRSRTLAAQYRYLPALKLVKQSDAFVRGRVQWVVLLDDDSLVFVPRLRALLARFDARRPWMLGEFKRDHSYACGGAGAIFSRAGLAQLDLDACIERTSRRCMQSDWQLADCVRHSPSVRLEHRWGCGSCAVRNCSTGQCAQRLRDGCHFMQSAAPLVPWLHLTNNCSPDAVRSPSIVHGVGAAALQRTRPATAIRADHSTCRLAPFLATGRPTSDEKRSMQDAFV